MLTSESKWRRRKSNSLKALNSSRALVVAPVSQRPKPRNLRKSMLARNDQWQMKWMS